MIGFLDIEASSLARQGYPIEIAWVFETGESEAFLIRPADDWTDWDVRAEAIHGISRHQLEEHGRPVAEVASHTLEALAGHDIYASSPNWDGKWLSRLLRAGGLPRHALRLKDTDALQLQAVLDILGPETNADQATGIIGPVRESWAARPIAHRALADAEAERQIWLAIKQAAQLRLAARK